MTLNEFVGRMAVRARELADLKMDQLRYEYPEAVGDTRAEILRASKGESRGRIIEAILVEEFSSENDFSF